MYVRNSLRGKTPRRLTGAGVMVLLSGCGVSLLPQDDDGPRSTLSFTAIDLTPESTYLESNPNDFFESAEHVDVSQADQAIEGRIDGGTDVDIYDLGPVSAGDRVMVTMEAEATLSAAVALFDADGTALLVNDHRNAYLGRTEPFLDVFIGHDSPDCYVAVTSTPGFDSWGDYTLVAGKEVTGAPPAPRPDTVLLVFNGGTNVRIGRRAAIDVPAFDAADISPDFAGKTSTMIRELVERVRTDYAAVDITILSTSEGNRYAVGMSRVFFGTFDPALLGVAEGVDEFNLARDQEAIVFTDTFDAFMRTEPDVEDMAQALANVTSHEIGHLLGMVHTADAAGIMDVTASLRELTYDQVFTRSPIYSAVFPLGYQDGPRYLIDMLGIRPGVTSLAPLFKARPTAKFFDGDLTPARVRRTFSSCGLR